MKSIFARLTVLVLAGSVPLAALIFFTGESLRETSLEDARADRVAIARLAAGSESRVIEGLRSALLTAAASSDVVSLDAARCADYLRRVRDQGTLSIDFWVIDPEGVLLCHSSSVGGTLSFRDREYFRLARESGRFSVGTYMVSRTTGRPSLGASLPIRDGESRVIAFIVGAVDLLEVAEVARGGLTLPKGTSLTVTDRKGTTLYSAGDGGGEVGERYPQRALVVSGSAARDGSIEIPGNGAAPAILAWSAVGDLGRTDLMVYVSADRSNLVSAINRAQFHQLLLLVLMALVGLAFALWFGRRTVVRPVKELLSRVRVLGGLERAGEGTASGAGELADLAEEVERVGAALQRRTSEFESEARLARQRQERLDASQRIGNMGNWELSVATGELWWSDQIYRIFGLPPERANTSFERFRSCIHVDDLERFDAAQRAALEGTAALDVTHRVVRPDGEVRWVHELGELQTSTHDRQRTLIGTVRDITERRLAVQQLALLHTAVSRLNDIVLITEAEPFDEPGPRIVFVNDAFERRTGYSREEVLGKTPRILQGPKTSRAELDRIRAAMERWEPCRAQLVNYTKSGGEFSLELDLVPIANDAGWYTHWVAVERDITERLALEDQLRQSQRLEAVGQLTGGVAHDFNNLLTVILGNADLLAEDQSLDESQRLLAEMVSGAAQRGAELTQRLLAFARKQALEPSDVDVNSLVANMNSLLRRTLDEHVELEIVRGAGLWRALIDPTQLESALLNLCINARDAMQEHGGRLTIETANTKLDEDYAAQHPDVQAGQYVMLAVTDTGTGIPPEHLKRVFEPFFTTKEKSKGTGLGLAMVYGFVKQSGGHVSIYSELGHGTTVRLYLPRALGPQRALQQVPLPDTAEGGAERILVVEDDAMVRAYATGQLRTLGYEIIEAENGPAALQIIRERDDIDLLFTDVVMPGGMSGRQLYEEAQKIRPQLPVLYTSGYTENAIVHQGRLDPGVQLLVKPYRRPELARKILNALQGTDS